MGATRRQIDAIPAEAVRPPAVAGGFYPGSADSLRELVDELMQTAASTASQNLPVAAISPHAGYMYSGGVAAHLYKRLQQRPVQTVAVIAPSHFEYFPFVTVFTGHSYRTPLGEVPVARDLANRLAQSHELIEPAWNGHRFQSEHSEHAIEVQLPFLQVAVPGCRVIPIIMGDQSWELCEVLGQKLAELAAESPVLILVSSDLSHYHHYDEAVSIDKRFIDLLLTLDPERLFQALKNRECEACGGGPMVAAMVAAKQLAADSVEVLCYKNSGDVCGDRGRVVGYVAATLERSQQSGGETTVEKPC